MVMIVCVCVLKVSYLLGFKLVFLCEKKKAWQNHVQKNLIQMIIQVGIIFALKMRVVW